MGAIVPLTLGKDKKDAVGSFVGMTIAIASWAMLFGALLISYLILRGRQQLWPPAGMSEIPRSLPIVNTVILLVSSFLLYLGIQRYKTGDHREFRRYLFLTIGFGFVFLGLQALLWSKASALGIHLYTGVFGSVFYLMTILHAVHIIGGLAALLYLVPGAVRGVSTQEGIIRARLISWFWHFLAVMWIAIFVSIFLY